MSMIKSFLLATNYHQLSLFTLLFPRTGDTMRFSQASQIALLTAAGYLPTPADAKLYGVPVKTQYGYVEGFKYFNTSTTQKYFNLPDSDVAAFLGVPYAASTAYENRWKVAQPREPWNGTFNASSWGPSCPIARQADAGYTLGEDCLVANIWTPATSSNASLPVLVWNYGSGETSTEPLYDCGGLATKGVVTVSYNYRDAAFGFLAHPELNEESGHNASGNYGIQDFITVLEWVRDNIAEFGGDPNRVVIAGQSFGSAQVYHAVNSPLAKGLFHGMIAESGIRDPYDPTLGGLADSYRNMTHALAVGENYTSFHNVSSIAELRTLSMESLLEGSDDKDYTISNVTSLFTAYPPLFKTTLDNYVVPSTYLDSLLNGPASDVPMITGNNKDESGAATTTNYTLAQYNSYCTQWFGNMSTEYFSLYPATDDSSANMQWNAMCRDLSLVSSDQFVNGWVQSAKSPFYTYYWDYAPPGQTAGAYHEAEINYVLNNLYGTDLPWGDYDIWLADVMSSYWANFVKTLDPNTGGSFRNGRLARWENNGEGNGSVMHFGGGFGMIKVGEERKVEFLRRWLREQVPW